VTDGLDWILQDPDYVAGRGRIVNLSFHVLNSEEPTQSVTGEHAIEKAIQRLIDAGTTVVVAAGNENIPIMNEVIPARMTAPIVVGGTTGCWPNLAGGTPGCTAGAADELWESGPWSGNKGTNYGPTIDIFAPADRIKVAHWSSATAARPQDDTYVSSGTSFSAPMVAGVAVKWLTAFPGENNQEIAARIINGATTSAHGLNLNVGTTRGPNRLLYLPPCKQRSV
jgi:hypothetical protein